MGARLQQEATDDKTKGPPARVGGDPDAAVPRLARLLDAGVPILLQGETGTGKEVLARAIHAASGRGGGAFVAVACAALPAALIEAELFGYEAGAYAGARPRGSLGLIRAADGGTLFLDEVGDMPLALQTRLLRVLQERAVSPLGSARSRAVDLALVCATQQPLRHLVDRGRFRADLYYRLNGLALRLPPLRERSDLPALALGLLAERIPPGAPARISAPVMALFLRHPWPGNLRQLASVLRTAAAMARGERELRLRHLPQDFFDELGAPAASLEQQRLAAIARALERGEGNLSAAARLLGVSRNTLYRRLRAEAERTPA
jgi:transcriptional regulator of acetoin/glycerol metabolism